MMLNSKSVDNNIVTEKRNVNSLNVQMPFTGMIPVDDTMLTFTDSGGSGTPVLYLNGQFATQRYWRKVIAELGSGFRHVTYDERARGKKSGRSAHYSFGTCVCDVDAVLAARDIKQCLLVGWSYGAFVAAHWASRNPDRCLGTVLVDGAQPYDWMTNDMENRMRKLFRRLNLLMWLLRPTGLTPRMSATEMAEINIELGWLARVSELGPVMDKIIVPTRYVLASGSSFGSKGEEQEKIRTGVNTVVERNSNIKISEKVSSNHDAILKKDYRAIASALREVSGQNIFVEPK